MKLWGGLCGIGAALFMAMPVQAQPKTPRVRVRLKRELQAAEVKGFDLHIGNQTKILRAGLPGFEGARIWHLKDGWRIQWEHRAEAQVIARPKLEVEASTLSLQGAPVPTHLELVPNAHKAFDVIADLPLESYLKGVLPSEMPASWPKEALKAQAVAARSFVLASLKERRNQAFDVDSTIFDQVYEFSETASHHQKIAAVLAATKGKVLLDSEGVIVKAYYHADCGGMTALPSEVWTGHGKEAHVFARRVCHFHSHKHWRVFLSRLVVQRRLQHFFSLPKTEGLLSLRVQDRTFSKRVAHLLAAFSGGLKKQITAHEFRKLMGFRSILSANFTITGSPDTFEVAGVGMGHGVGMCQRGAKHLALQGKSYLAILKFFYPGAIIGTLHPHML